MVKSLQWFTMRLDSDDPRNKLDMKIVSWKMHSNSIIVYAILFVMSLLLLLRPTVHYRMCTLLKCTLSSIRTHYARILSTNRVGLVANRRHILPFQNEMFPKRLFASTTLERFMLSLSITYWWFCLWSISIEHPVCLTNVPSASINQSQS